jgi:hypothetical protein
LCDDVFRFDRLALELVFRQRLLETEVRKIVLGLIAEAALSNDEGDWLFSGGRRDRSDS